MRRCLLVPARFVLDPKAGLRNLSIVMTLTLNYGTPVTLVGGGARDAEMLSEARALAPHLIAADGAADWLTGLGERPDAVIGDMDSIRHPDRLGEATRVVCLTEQETTDFEKCLYATEAPAYLGVGFTGRRVDHMMTVFNTMLRRPQKTVLLLGEHEVIALVPPRRKMRLTLAEGAVVSFVALMPVTGIASTGLEWPIDGLDLAPDGRTGTSNRARAAEVQFAFDRAGTLVMVGREHLVALAHALGFGREM